MAGTTRITGQTQPPGQIYQILVLFFKKAQDTVKF